MTTAAVIVAVDDAPRSKRSSSQKGVSRQLKAGARLARAGISQPVDEVVVVVGGVDDADALIDGITIIVDEAVEKSESSAVRAAIDYCARNEHSVVVVALAATVSSPKLLDGNQWEPLLVDSTLPLVVMNDAGRFSGMVRIDEVAWPLLPLDGALEACFRAHPELVRIVDLDAPFVSVPRAAIDATSDLPSQDSPASSPAPVEFSASPDDIEVVTKLLGRVPTGRFNVVVRDRSGQPIVIENAPFLEDGTPMPTRYWLVGPRERHVVGQLESTGGNQAAELAVDPAAIEECHKRYGDARDALIPQDHDGPRPSGGVGGTRVGVKCLHAHLANYLAGGRDPVGRWVVSVAGEQFSGPVAAIDCGTNSTRLLILDRKREPLERRMTITRLGQGVDETGELAKEAIERTVNAIAAYRELLDQHGVTMVRVVATSAARDASNSAEFFDAVTAVLGVRPELLDGADEGRLAYRGATAGLPEEDGPYLVVDIGGGSTELVAGQGNGGDPAVVSLAMGCVRISERFLKSDPITETELDDASSYIASLVDEALTSLPALLAPQAMIGVAGTVATLVTLDAGHLEYDPEALHHRELTRDAVEGLLEELSGETVAERRAHPGVEAGRADVLVGGVLVLAEVMAACGQDKLIYSECDILDGIAQDLFDRVN